MKKEDLKAAVVKIIKMIILEFFWWNSTGGLENTYVKTSPSFKLTVSNHAPMQNLNFHEILNSGLENSV